MISLLGTRELVALLFFGLWRVYYQAWFPICVFLVFWLNCAYCVILENGVLLMYTLEGVSSVVNFITAYEESQ